MHTAQVKGNNKYCTFLKYKKCKNYTFVLTTKCKYAIMSVKGDVFMSEIRNLRVTKRLTQSEAAAMLGISLRSYKAYENGEYRRDSVKYKYILSELEKYVALDEDHGILTVEDIKSACKAVFDEYRVKYCILFGSYAKGTATEKSDVDLLISTDVTGLRFFGIAERLRLALKKRVDLLDLAQLKENGELLDEILKDGIRIYE